MGLLKDSVERRLSAAMGTRVSIDKLNFSLLGGSVEAFGVTVAGNDPATPLLTVRRIKAEVALAAALKKEFVVKSLTVERPVLTIARAADGRLNLPDRAKRPPVSDKASDKTSSASDAEGTWKFEAHKVLVIDGEARFHDATGYRASAERVLAEVKESGGDMEFTVMSDSLGRHGAAAAELGPVRLHGRAGGATDLSKLRRASIRATLQIGELLRGQLDLPSLDPIDAKLELNGTLADINLVSKLLPDDVKLPASLRQNALSGKVEVSARATYKAGKGLCVPELSIRAVDVRFVPRAATT